jgi:hypothetical protein
MKKKIKSENLNGKVGKLDKPSVILQAISNYSMVFDEEVVVTPDNLIVAAEETVSSDTNTTSNGQQQFWDEVADDSCPVASDKTTQHLEVHH